MCEARSNGRDNHNESFRVSWKIENFRYMDKRKAFYLNSQVFTMDLFRRTRWYLALYPSDSFSEKVGVFLFRSKDNYNNTISLNLIIKIIKGGTVLAKSSTISAEFENNVKTGHGDPALVALDNILAGQTESRFNDDDVLIECEVWKAENDLKVTKLIPEVNFYFQSDGKNFDLTYDFPSRNFDILEDIDQIEQKIAHVNNQCRIGTVINVEETELDWTVERFSALQKNKKRIAVIKHAHSESFAVLTLHLNNDDVLQIYVLLNKTLTGYESVHCHLSVRDNHNKVERSFQKVCYLKLRKLPFTDVIKKSDVLAAKEKLLDTDALNLHFVMTFVLGCSPTYTIYSTGLKSNVPQPDAQENRLSRQMEDIFVSRKHCDVTLRAGSRDISCHKAIVCHMSPVLDAMFTADMQEKNTGVVHVSDVDPDTLNTLLRYMYTGEMDDTSVQGYMKLFVASDKYQVSSLTRECTKMLEQNLSVDNVCGVLLCADAHSDMTLKKCSMEFIRSNVSRVFSSEQWKSIAKDNPTLASEVLLLMTTNLQ